MKHIKKTSYKFNYLNPTKESNIEGNFAPACRGSNQLIIYNENNIFMNKKRQTGVNPYGLEASVNKYNEVVEINDRVTTLKNGFVLSGHGLAHEFIEKNIFLGSKIKIDYDNHIVEVITNKYKSHYIEFKDNKKRAIKKYNEAIKNGYVINKKKVNDLFNKINDINSYFKCFIRLNNPTSIQIKKFNNLYNKSIKLFDLLYLYTSYSSFISSRNVWVRPFEQNLSEILNTLHVCKRCNINGIYVESFYNGGIPGISKITNTTEEVINGYYGPIYKNDYLKAFISEAHKLNIEVHAWVESFFVGEKSSQFKYKDEWKMINYNGSSVQGDNPEGNEYDFVWIDPANPECLQYVLSIYKELLENYDFDGINVDYVRYPHGNYDIKYSSGYTNYAMNEFKKIYNLSGDVKELVKDKIIMDKWTLYRCDKITHLMNNVKKLVNNVKPSCFISMAVVSDLDYAIKNKMQNWKLWARKGWIDLTFPMAYYEGCSEVANATKELVSFNKENAFSYTGIMCMEKRLPSMLVVKQINTLFENNADGYNIFQLGDLLTRKECQFNLINSVNKFKSVHPHENIFIVLKAFIKEMKARKPYLKTNENVIDNLIIDIKNIINTKPSLPTISNLLKDIKNNLTDKVLIKEVNKLIRYTNVSNNIMKRKDASN